MSLQIHSVISQMYRKKTQKAIFTSEKLDKLDNLVETVKNLKINNDEYYESKSSTASDAQSDFTLNTETITHTSNRKFEQKVLSYRNIPVLPPPTKTGIGQGIAEIILMPHTLLMFATKEIFTNTASGGAWIHRTTRQVNRKGVNRINPGDIGNDIGIV